VFTARGSRPNSAELATVRRNSTRIFWAAHSSRLQHHALAASPVWQLAPVGLICSLAPVGARQESVALGNSRPRSRTRRKASRQSATAIGRSSGLGISGLEWLVQGRICASGYCRHQRLANLGE